MSGCYRCGSSLGNEAQLCPECNEKKLRQYSAWQERSHSSRTSVRRSPLSRIFTTLGAVAAGLVLVSIGWVYRAHIRVYTGGATADDIYQICLEGGAQMTSQAKEGMTKAVVSGFMVEVCADMKKSCNQDPHGERCETAREFVRMMARG